MTFTVIDADQRSPTWFAARLGRLTSTGAKDMLAAIKSGEAAARRDLRTRLVLERLTGESQDDVFQSPDMARGIELEAEAFGAFEAETGIIVQRVGFLQCDDLMCGASPDGVIGDFDAVVELKVPRSANHLASLRAGVVPAAYIPQMTHHLYCSGAEVCHFFSYDPRFPEPLRTFHAELKRTDVNLDTYDHTVRAFLDECDRELESLQAIGQALRRTA